MADIANPFSVVIDASVLLNWLLPKEPYQSQAKLLIHRYGKQQIDLSSVSQFPFEVANGIYSAILKKRITKELAPIILRKTLKLPFILHLFNAYGDIALKLSIKYGISIYGSAYIALAKQTNREFLTADKKLFRKVNKLLPQVKWLGNHQ